MVAEHDVDGAGDGQSEDLRERTVAFVRAFGLHRPETTPCGQPLPVSVAHALMELESNGPMSQTTLASRVRLEKSTVSRLVDALVGKRWVERGRDPDDGRVALLHLTEAGRRTAVRIAEARAARFVGILRRIPVDERAGVLRALSVLAEAARDDDAPPDRQGGKGD